MLKQPARPLSIAATLVAAVLITGCASNEPVEPPRASSLTDAQDHARGGRDRAKSASQLTIGFGNKNIPAQATEATSNPAALRELAITRTFLGTTSCPVGSGTSCMPLRLNITLSPEGLWRMRATPIQHTDTTPVVSQGCWYQTGSEPSRIILQSSNEAVLADFTFVHDHQLRVNIFNSVRPTLETHLSRQPDVDPISELENQTGPICRSAVH